MRNAYIILLGNPECKSTRNTKATEHHAMKAYWGVEIELHALLT
jgi:hypothetical protein